MGRKNTRTEILSTASRLLSSKGVGGVSFDAIAQELGCSKQAVLYWFPTRSDLMAAMFLPSLRVETEVAIAALRESRGRRASIASFVRAVANFHLGDLDRFRMMYLAPQTARGKTREWSSPDVTEQVHPVTDALYQELAARLEAADATSARREAVAVHSAVLGLVLMFALAEAVRDPLKHPEADLIEALIVSLSGH